MTLETSTDIFDFLTPKEDKGIAEEQLHLSGLEKVFYYLNKEKNYFFSNPDETDLRIVLRHFNNKECIKKLAQCTKSIIGNVNKDFTTEFKVKATFNNHVFYRTNLLGKLYFLDLMEFPSNLKDKDMGVAITEFERFIKTNSLIKEKKELLNEIGYTYFIHYDPNKLISYVLSDGD